LWRRTRTPRIADIREAIAMLVLDDSAASHRDLRGAYFDGSLELLSELAATIDLDTALPRLSGIASKMLPHDALRMACFDRRGQLTVNASTGDVPDVPVCDGDELIVDDLRTDSSNTPAGHRAQPPLAVYRSALSVSMRAPESRVTVAFWSRQPRAFSRTHVPLARRLAYHLSLAICRGKAANPATHVDETRTQRVDAGVRSGVGRLKSAVHLGVVGESVEWRDVLRKAAQVAPTETTALVTGESGTGKEVVARFIHASSPRKSGPFVALNCAALPEQLLEAELFGYERGAFTSAHQSKPGQVELASGGVLFLDEVSEMSLSAQAKFLRVLQEREFQRLGGTRLLKANVRVIAATNRDLRKAVERGEFREDLFYRLSVFDIQIPPLRARPADIVPLSDTFLQELGRSMGRTSLALTRDAHQALVQYDWPGNVRELRNVLERAAILCDGALIDASHLALPASNKSLRSDTTDLGVVERTTIANVLRECRGNKTRAARRLGLSRTQLHLRIRKYRLGEAASA
jgi:transcriptional regulator with GAF, ATPase, and Fis domain